MILEVGAGGTNHGPAGLEAIVRPVKIHTVKGADGVGGMPDDLTGLNQGPVPSLVLDLELSRDVTDDVINA